MADTETTFGSFEMDERFKKLERSLKLALLKKKHNNNIYSNKITSWPSISTINTDTLNSNCATSLQTSIIGSEVLASSNNLRNILSRKKIRNNKQEMISTSSVKEYNVNQNHIDQFIMPPPTGNTVYCTYKKPQDIYISSDCKRAESNMQIRNTPSKSSTCASITAGSDKEHLHSFVTPMSLANYPQKVNRVFSRWRVMLNDQHELIIKGTLECGKIARSKPIVKRYTATHVESKFKHKYNLQGNIIDERNELPDYIRGKFHNGFPDDWENVYQVWQTYVSQKCPITFRWPTTITDSDDDLKSELTDLTYMINNRSVPVINSYKNEYVRLENPSIKNSPEKVEKCYDYLTRNFQKLNEKDCSSVEFFISDTENATLITQTKNTKLMCEEDKPDIKINPASSFKKTNKLKDILQEDKLKIIINNLADKNCSSQYIDKIIEMFDCLDYVISYKTGSEHKCDSMISTNYEMSKSEVTPLQQIVVDNNNARTKNLENESIETISYMQSIDPEYIGIRNNSNPIQMSNPKNSVESKYNDKKDLDESESEIYAGIPKISIERISQIRRPLRKTFKCKVKKKMVQPNSSNIQNHTSPQYNKEELKSVHTTVPITNLKGNLFSNEFCVNTIKNEIEVMTTRKYQETVTQEPQEMTFSSDQRNYFDIYGKNKSTLEQKKQFNPFEAQKVNLNVIKQKEVPHKVYENVHSQFMTDVDYSSDAASININKQKSEIQNRNIIKMHTNSDIVINSENNSNSPQKSCISRELRRKFVEQPKSEISMKKAKPTIISSMPVNLNLKINNAEQKLEQSYNLNCNIIENEENQCTNIPLDNTSKNISIMKTPMKPTIITDNCKSIVHSAKQDHLKTNNRNESDNINYANSLKQMTNPITRQSRNRKSTNINVLTTWMPKVIYYAKSTSELGLIFEGKLLNDVGHVVNRKFTTDIVLRRLSPTLIETINHEFYELFGCLNVNKHKILPKELVKQCRHGCPAKIEQFCRTWKTLQYNNMHMIEDKSHDTTMDSLSVPVSSRGRRIVPPLCYWKGERITLKDNNPVYSPGNSQESLLTSFIENPKKKNKEKKNSMDILKQDTNKQIMSPKSNEASDIKKHQIVLEKAQSSNQLPRTTIINNTKTKHVKKSQKSIKRQVAQQLTSSSTDFDEEKEVSPRKHTRKLHINVDTNASRYSMVLRKREKIKTSSNEISYDNTIKSKRNAVNKPTYTYFKNVSVTENLLSDNPASPK